MKQPTLIALTALVLILASAPAAGGLPDQQTLRAWVQEMKRSDRGPFARIRWFCRDGMILPPEPYACREHGGGSQHGEWSERVKRLREHGYHIANVLADLDVQGLLARADAAEVLGQMLIERYLMRADDGWILRRARYYRGALQAEGERAGARRLLLALSADPVWIGQRYPLLRAAARLLPHGRETASVSEMRQLSTSIAERDPGFVSLRNKIHAHPGKEDIGQVREYLSGAPAAVAADLQRLLGVLEKVYSGASAAAQLNELAAATRKLGELHRRLSEGAAHLGTAADDGERLAVSGELLALLREQAAAPADAGVRLMMLDASAALGDEHFVAGAALRQGLEQSPRLARVRWLGGAVDGAYGAGLLTARQRGALHAELTRLKADQVSLAQYKGALEYVALAPGWGAQRLRFHFGEAVQRLARIEPAAGIFMQDVLRASPLLFYSQALDGLLVDANRLAGVPHRLFGEDVGAGLRALNPGLARGTLRPEAVEGSGDWDPQGIYLLPETTSELPPVAGILTAGEGNPLSHVQLLARNLGIPNVAVDQGLLARIRAAAGSRVLLAVSPGGAIRLERAREQDSEAGADTAGQGVVIRPDVDKLDLDLRDPIALSLLRAQDSGRVVGPKAAKLGELKHHFPEAVAEGLAIPFGAFRALLEQPYADSGQSVYAWMLAGYRRIETLPEGSAQRAEASEALRSRLHEWIAGADPGPEFRQSLRKAMARTFGADGSYGVFVRSDTNVEDLPGFTGAGLNLTVPNVVGVDNVLAAIPRVWASPFTARAFAWRQGRMERPEHVYPAVLLLRSVAADKSGVMVTRDVDSGEAGWLTIAVNEGVGGAVDGQAAESLRVNVDTGQVRLMAEATASVRRRIDPAGGVSQEPVSGAPRVLEPAEIGQLIELARTLPERFPAIVDEQGEAAPADIEFGFEGGELRLFQIRPFLDSARARDSELLKSMDAQMRDLERVGVDMRQAGGERS